MKITADELPGLFLTAEAAVEEEVSRGSAFVPGVFIAVRQGRAGSRDLLRLLAD